ncbi:HDOD domain-containing protein [Hydrogenophaga sp.]|uniref:HDOD domain-containing protein n=1 Tax=Hydrogenophaga sp. TaxID=1904254 RepID=UPI0019974D55|nr:HDOD domain-containing protein [Hydrogenophaga sp.]MBD3892608.1 HDOD domain-containing protein [Hydrogenophaga sp.]
MNHSVLASVLLSYQPVWSAARQLAAVRLRVQTLPQAAINASHLLELLGNDWPAAAPVLIVALDAPALLQQALACAPVHNTWLEVPHALFQNPDTQARLALAARSGHRLLRQTDLAHAGSEDSLPVPARGLLQLRPQDADELLHAAAVGAPPPHPAWLAGHLLAGVSTQALAAHCLDRAAAWGLLGWPENDVLHAHRQQTMGCAADVIAQIRQAIEAESSLEHLERLVRQDPVLAYRLLLLVNSAAYGLRHEVGSLRHALMMLGFSALERWLQDQLPGSEANPDLHPVRYAMVMRARLAQHLLEPGSEDNLRAEVFLTALFSQLDRLLCRPLAELLDQLPLSSRVFDALLRNSGPYGRLLEVARLQGDPEQAYRLPEVCEQLGIGLEHGNRALLRMLATSRDYASPRSQRLL